MYYRNKHVASLQVEIAVEVNFLKNLETRINQKTARHKTSLFILIK